MEVLKPYPADFTNSFRGSFSFLTNFNIRYLQDDQPPLKKYWRFAFIIPAIVILIVATTSRMLLKISEEKLFDVAYMLPPYLVILHATSKACVIVPQTKHISLIIQEIGGLWRTEFTKKQTRIKNNLLRHINICTKANYWVALLGSSQYLLSPILETVLRRFILRQDCEILFPMAASYPFNSTSNWFIYTAVYSHQVFTMYLIVFIYSGSGMIMVTLCALVATEFLMLNEDMSSIKPILKKERKRNETNSNTIEDFIQRHQKLIWLSQQLDNVFNRLIFIDLLFVGITTCAFRFAGEFARTRGITYMLNNYVAVFNSMLTVLFLCYYGELLTGASSDVGNAVYESLWYDGSMQYQNTLRIIIKISQKPCCLTSMKYAVVSLNLFTKVVSTTWSYFSLLNSVYTVEEGVDN